jgi:hypothetical protein
MKGAETALAQLARISLVIRKAGAQLRHQRADNALQSSLSKYNSFKERLEFLFLWKPYQEDISPYHQLLLHRLTSNETQKNLSPGQHAWRGSSSPSIPGVHLKAADWQSIYEWILSQDTDNASEAVHNRVHSFGNDYPFPATLSLPYNRDPSEPVLATAEPPQPWLTTYIRKTLTDPGRLTTIQKRLIKANIKRLHRFTFAKGDAKPPKPTPQMESRVVEPVSKAIENPSAPVPVVSAIPRPVIPTTPAHSKPSIVAKSVLSATELGSQQVLDFKAPSPSNITRASATGQKLKYPPRPKISGDRANFECHYCCQVLPRVYGEQGWR